MTLSVKGLHVTLSVNYREPNQHKMFWIMLSVIMLNVAFYLLLC
jgi:hypothetical protein